MALGWMAATIALASVVRKPNASPQPRSGWQCLAAWTTLRSCNPSGALRGVRPSSLISGASLRSRRWRASLIGGPLARPAFLRPVGGPLAPEVGTRGGRGRGAPMGRFRGPGNPG